MTSLSIFDIGMKDWIGMAPYKHKRTATQKGDDTDACEHMRLRGSCSGLGVNNTEHVTYLYTPMTLSLSLSLPLSLSLSPLPPSVVTAVANVINLYHFFGTALSLKLCCYKLVLEFELTRLPGYNACILKTNSK